MKFIKVDYIYGKFIEMKLLFKFLFILISILLHSSSVSPQTITFSKTFDYDQFDFGFSTQQTNDGGFMLFGESGHNGPYEQDMNLMKADGHGNILWNKIFGLPGLINFGISAQQTFDNGYILCGSFGDLGNDTLALIKTDSNGNEEWHRLLDAHQDRDVGQSVKQTPDSGFVAVGFSDDDTIVNPYIVKTDKNGNLEWSHVFPQSNYELCQSISVLSNGYIACGRTNSKGHGNYDIYLMRFDLLGDTVWTKTFGTNLNEWGSSVAIVQDGGFIITGYDYFAGGDVWLIKTDSSGNEIWTKKFGGPYWDFGYDVKTCSDGGYVISGRKEISSGNNQAYCIRTDSLGNTLWERVFPKRFSSDLYSVSQNSDGGFILFGQTTDTVLLGSDFYYLRLDSSGLISVPEYLNIENQFTIGPNPTNGILNFYFKNLKEEQTSISILDLAGHELFDERLMINDNFASLDVSTLTTGMYLLKIKLDDKLFLTKLIRE